MTGFTKSIIGLNFSKEENKEKYELVLQNYEKMLREFPSNNESTPMSNTKPTIQEAICIANIIKISYSLLGNLNYKRLYKLCERCEFIAEKNEEEKEKEWYKEFKKLFDEIKSTYDILQFNL